MPTLRCLPRPLLLTLAALGLYAQEPLRGARADEPAGFPTPSAASPAPAAEPAPRTAQSHLPPPATRYFPPGAATTGTTGTSGSIGTAPVYESREGVRTTPVVRRSVTGTGIVEVTPREVVAAGGGGTEFQVKFRVAGDAGRQFYLNAVFFDPATGQAVRAERSGFGDAASGALYLILTPVSHAGGSSEYRALLQLPSDAMAPVAAGGERRVEARIQLFRRGLSGGSDESMDWVMVPFTVRAPGAGPAPVAPTFAAATGGFPAPVAAGPNVAPAAGATATRIVGVTKNHNQPATDGRLHLHLDVAYEIQGERGRSFYLHALFFDRATGQAVKTVRPEFADRSTGALYLLLQPMVNSAPDGKYKAVMRIPYDAFPRPDPGSTLDVECRITLFRRDPGTPMDTAMDLSTITFTVHGD